MEKITFQSDYFSVTNNGLVKENTSVNNEEVVDTTPHPEFYY